MIGTAHVQYDCWNTLWLVDHFLDNVVQKVLHHMN